jgi:hypothetical protein
MSRIFAGNIIRLLRKDVESGNRVARQVSDFAQKWLELLEQPSPDPDEIARLYEQLKVERNADTPFIQDMYWSVASWHKEVNILPYLPTCIEYDVTEKQQAIFYRVTAPVIGEATFRRQTCLGHYGHVVLILEPHISEKHCRIQWAVNEEEIPKFYMESVFEGIKHGSQEPFDDDGYLVFVNLKVIGGSMHETDSRELDFKVAGRLAFKNALAKANLMRV